MMTRLTPISSGKLSLNFVLLQRQMRTGQDLDHYSPKIRRYSLTNELIQKVDALIQKVDELIQKVDKWTPNDEKFPQNVDIIEDVKLHEENDAWKPTRKNNMELDPEEEKTEKLYKTFRGILNKLTLQNFSVLLEQVSTLPIDNELRLSGVVNLLFEKTICEPNFTILYANMCKLLGTLKVPLKQTTKTDGKYVNFRKLIVTRCQQEFEKDTNVMQGRSLEQIKHEESEEQKKELVEELQEKKRKSKLRSLGNIRFIGELYKLRMLTAGIMHDCLQKLLNAGDEDSLECLCKLLTTIGKELDSPQQSNNRHNDRDHRMNNYFLKLRDVVRKQQQLSSRVRFMLQDVMDLRENNWMPRKKDDNDLKTVNEICRSSLAINALRGKKAK